MLALREIKLSTKVFTILGEGIRQNWHLNLVRPLEIMTLVCKVNQCQVTLWIFSYQIACGTTI